MNNTLAYLRCRPTGTYILVTVLTLILPIFAFAQSLVVPDTRPGGELTIKLVTVEPGDEVYAWWGHTGIIVENRRTGVSKFYDYGLFSFRQERFYSNFAQGRLMFEVGVWPTQNYLEHYRNLNRTVRIRTLSMPAEQKLAMSKALDRAAQPENRIYLYDHYYDNCATRPRDVLNEFTGGVIKKETDVGAGTTFREITRKYTQHAVLMDFLLMYLMSDVIDHEITIWETMFLPDELEATAVNTRIPAEGGRLTGLVLQTQDFNIAHGRRTIPEVAPPLERPAALAGIVFAFICITGALLSLRFPRTGLISLGTAIALTGFIAGILGSLLLFMSQFTDHVVTFGNENVIFTNPLSFALLVSGILMARRSKRYIEVNTIVTGVFTLAIAVLAILKLVLPDLEQQNWPQIALFGPVYLAQFACCLFLYVRKVRSNRPVASESRP